MFLGVEQASNEADDQRYDNVVVCVKQREEKQPEGEDENNQSKSTESFFDFLKFFEDNHGCSYNNKLNITQLS